MRDIRTGLVAHLHTMPLSFFTGTKTGEIMNRVSSDVDNIDNVVTGTLVTIVTNVFMIVTTVPTLFVLDWRLAIVALLVIPLMILPLSPVGRKMYEVRKKTREKRDEIESITQETLSISGITLIKSFVRERFERERFYRVGSDLMGLEIRLAMVGRWFIAAITAMVVVGPAVGLAASGGWLAITGGLTVGTIVAFSPYLGRLYRPGLVAGRRAGADRLGLRGLRAHLRVPRHEARGRREARRARAARRARPGRLRGRALRLHARAHRARRRDVPHRARPDGGLRRPLGRRQDHDHEPGAALLRPAVRHGASRRPRRARPDAGAACARTSASSPRRRTSSTTRSAAICATRGPTRPSGGDRRRARRQHPRLHRLAARRLRHDRRRARPQALRRRAPAPGDRARAAQEPAHPDPRRGDQRAGLRQRGGDPGRARAADGGPHEPRDRAPPLDDPQRRRDLRGRGRPDRRARHARRADRPRRRLRPPVLEAVPRPRGNRAGRN